MNLPLEPFLVALALSVYYTTLLLQGDGFPELRASLWQAEASVAAAAQALVPQMTENRKKVGIP